MGSDEAAVIWVIDGSTNTLLKTIANPFGGLAPQVAVNPITNKVYVTAGPILVINGATDEVEATIALSNGPTDIAVNPTNNRVYVAEYDGSTGKNVIEVIDGATNTVIGTPILVTTTFPGQISSLIRIAAWCTR